VSNVCSVQAEFDHQALPRRQLTLLTKLEINKHVVTEHLLNYLQVRIWIICVRLRTVSLVHAVPNLRALFFLFRTLFKKHLSQNIFLLFVAVVVLHIVVVRLVKDRVIIMIAVWILVPYPPRLSCTQSLRVCVRIDSHWEPLVVLLVLIGTSSVVLILIRACD